jgi:hypothetical protein
MADPDHSEEEERFILLGLSARLRLLIVCHTYREGDEVIRLVFSKAKPNPYAKRLKKEVTLRLDEKTVDYFERLSEETGIPSRTLINLYLRECAASGKRLALQ